MAPDCDPKDIPKSCPIFPFFRDSEGNEFPRDCIGWRCQWWWKCREPEQFKMDWTPIISGMSYEEVAEVADSINKAAQKLEAKISTARR